MTAPAVLEALAALEEALEEAERVKVELQAAIADAQEVCERYEVPA